MINLNMINLLTKRNFTRATDAATVGANQLDAVLSGWGYLIGSRQRLQAKLRRVYREFC